MTTERLPLREAFYDVIAPRGGYRRRLREFDLDDNGTIELEIQEKVGLQLSFWLKVHPPFKRDVILSPFNDSIYNIARAPACFISCEGGEDLVDMPIVYVWADINTDMVMEGEPCGELKMIRYIDTETRQMGA